MRIHVRDNHFYVSFPSDNAKLHGLGGDDANVRPHKSGSMLRWKNIGLLQAYSCQVRLVDTDFILYTEDDNAVEVSPFSGWQWSFCSGRFEKFLFGNSVIFKAESDYIEFYYGGLKPDVHYVSIQPNMTDLKEKFDFAIAHDDMMEKIASNMQKSAHESMVFGSIAC